MAASLAVEDVISALRRLAKKKVLDGMARYGIPSDHALGVSVGDLQKLAKRFGRSHDLAADLWATGIYEARMMAAYVDEPERVSAAQMERWCRDFDNWAICDTICFALFDRTPHAWSKVKAWAAKRDEYVKRAAFALLWSLTVHDKEADDARFLDGLRLIERAADDERHYVKKAVSMALRATGKRNAALHAAAVEMARKLAGSTDATSKWIGKEALRDLSRASLVKKFAKR
jgi:3-methyladenine DNA glycosylase AlkD